MTHAIATRYRGIEYRSRLEARWAAFFDAIGWRHTYEPFDGDGYIPDFLIHATTPFLVEVKPAVTMEDYREPWQKINKGLMDHWQGPVFLAGVTPLPSCYWESEFCPGVAGPMAARYHGVCDTCHIAYYKKSGREIFDDPNMDDWGKEGCPHWEWFWTNPADWAHWALDDSDSIQLTYRDRLCRLTGTGTGIRYDWRLRDRLEAAWADACNAVKWHSRDAS